MIPTGRDFGLAEWINKVGFKKYNSEGGAEFFNFPYRHFATRLAFNCKFLLRRK